MEVTRSTPSQQSEQVHASKRAEARQQAAVREAQAREQRPQKAETIDRKPTINSQGQTIGSRLHVTA